MKDFKEFRLETFNSLLPLLKEIVDNYFKVHSFLKTDKFYQKLKELKEEKDALEKTFALKERFSDTTNVEIKDAIDKVEKEISDTEELIKAQENEIDDLESSITEYNNFFIGISIGFLKNQNIILEKAEDVKIEYLREYFYLMFRLESNYGYHISRENLFSKEAKAYVIKYLRENESEKIANKKIAILKGIGDMYQNEFVELFK